MKAYIRYIGVVDKLGATHAVPFSPGVNVVTGRSSTGKSALIEIFDFCFGCDDFTIPEGVITERAAIYFCILAVRDSNVILGRRRDETKAFLKEVPDLKLSEPLSLGADFFDPAFFWPLTEFKKELGRYFGIQVIVTDHADHLKLKNNQSFEELVKGRRWRTRGFIAEIPG